VWNIAQPVSLDMLDARAIREKATNWTGRIYTLRPAEHNAKVVFLVGLPPSGAESDLCEAASDALQILSGNLEKDAQVITEDRGDELAAKIERDLAHMS
jgi:hypothetical protein